MEKPPFKELRLPTQCVLWEKPALVATKVSDRFETIENFADESHLSRALLKCRECGQLYFFEFYEKIDWNGGDDAQYSTYIPVEERSDIERMRDGSVFDLFYFTPRLQWDHRTGQAGSSTKWIGK